MVTEVEAVEHSVDQQFYYRLTLSRTRSGVPPIKNIPIEKRRLSHSVIMNSYNRVFNAHGFGSSAFSDADADAGKYYYIHLDPYDPSPNTVRVIDEVSPLLVNPAKFETGAFYTYLIASIIGKDPKTNKTITLSKFPSQLYAVKVINMYEFGAKHHQIFYRMALQDEALFAEFKKTYDRIEYRLYAAGEIMCTSENTLLFNFHSGTYKMKKHISARRVEYEEIFVTHMMYYLSPKYTNIRFKHCPFITSDALPLTKKELARMRKHNIHLFLFDTPSQCKDMRNAVNCHNGANKLDANASATPTPTQTKNPTHYELQQIYKRISTTQPENI